MSEEKKSCKAWSIYIIQLLVQRLLEHKGHMYLYATVLEAPKLERLVCHSTDSISYRATERKSTAQSAFSYCLGGELSFH